MALEHVVDAGQVAGVLLDALGVVEAGRVDDAFGGWKRKRELTTTVTHVILKMSLGY